MSKKQGLTGTLLMMILVIILLASSSTISAEDEEWTAVYWNNIELIGDPQVYRTDGKINFDWGHGSPHGDINPDNFGARWNRTVHFAEEGMYRFEATMDDGMRVWIDDVKVIDSWYDSQEHVITFDYWMTEGDHHIQVDYYERGGEAVAQFSWSIPQGGGGGNRGGRAGGRGGGRRGMNAAPMPTPIPGVDVWLAEYYNNSSLDREPDFVRGEEIIDYMWGSTSPEPNVVNADHFSVRWSRQVYFAPGTYTFVMSADEGARVWVDGEQVIDGWSISGDVQDLVGVIELDGGTSQVVVEYFEYTGLAEARFAWFLGTPSIEGDPLPDGMGTLTGFSSMNVRSGPGVEHPAIGYILEGQIVGIIARDADGVWVKIQWQDGTSGWVNGTYLSTNVNIQALPVDDSIVQEE